MMQFVQTYISPVFILFLEFFWVSKTFVLVLILIQSMILSEFKITVFNFTLRLSITTFKMFWVAYKYCQHIGSILIIK